MANVTTNLNEYIADLYGPLMFAYIYKHGVLPYQRQTISDGIEDNRDIMSSARLLDPLAYTAVLHIVPKPTSLTMTTVSQIYGLIDEYKDEIAKMRTKLLSEGDKESNASNEMTKVSSRAKN